MNKYTFVEFIAAQEGNDFNVIEPGNLAWAIVQIRPFEGKFYFELCEKLTK